MPKNSTIINIQFLRAFAALSVIFYHTSAHFFEIGGQTSGNIFSFMSHIGYAGVDIFFIISGYIMWITTIQKQGFKSVLKFIYSRITRIYPVYWSFLIILSLMYSYKIGFGNIDIINSIFLTVSSSSKLLLQVAWTLQYEIYFYSLFSLLLFAQKKYRIFITFLLFFIIIFLQCYAIFYLNIYDKENFNTASTLYTFWFSPYILEFIMGIFIGYYFNTSYIRNSSFLLIPIILFPILAIIYQNTLGINLDTGYFLPERIFFFGFFSAFLLIFLIQLEYKNITFFPKFSLYLGDASYSLYLSHTIILLGFYGIGLRDMIKSYGMYQESFMLLIIISIIGYSILHHKYIELPLIKIFKKLIQ